jgi:hypothetical protein
MAIFAMISRGNHLESGLSEFSRSRENHARACARGIRPNHHGRTYLGSSDRLRMWKQERRVLVPLGKRPLVLERRQGYAHADGDRRPGRTGSPSLLRRHRGSSTTTSAALRAGGTPEQDPVHGSPSRTRLNGVGPPLGVGPACRQTKVAHRGRAGSRGAAAPDLVPAVRRATARAALMIVPAGAEAGAVAREGRRLGVGWTPCEIRTLPPPWRV